MKKKSIKKTVRVQLSIPEELMEKIDEDIDKLYTTRAAWFLRIAIEEIKKREKNIRKVIDLDI